MTSERDPALREAVERVNAVANGSPEYAVYPGPPTGRRKAIRADLRLILAALPQDDGWRDVETDPPPRGSPCGASGRGRMTEDEAKTKWCPFARAPLGVDGQVPVGASVVGRRTTGEPDAACLCIGSACMAWRWTAKPRTGRYHEVEDFTVSSGRRREALPDEVGDGYCGLAGSQP